jgi:hypothetical protein
MRESSMKENVSQKLPQIIIPPDQDRNQTEIELDPPAGHHLKEKDSSHDDHQIFDNRCQAIPK